MTEIMLRHTNPDGTIIQTPAPQKLVEITGIHRKERGLDYHLAEKFEPYMCHKMAYLIRTTIAEWKNIGEKNIKIECGMRFNDRAIPGSSPHYWARWRNRIYDFQITANKDNSKFFGNVVSYPADKFYKAFDITDFEAKSENFAKNMPKLFKAW
tara:strand:+ start:1784 stop:2245 length:462 start_codon:yes stop_codon:yes gene_type:complete